MLVDDDDIEFRSDHSLSDLDCDECTDSVHAVLGILRKRFASKEKRKHRKRTGFVNSHLGMDTPGNVLGCEAHNRVVSHDTFKHSAIWAYDPVEYWCPNCHPHFVELSDAARMRVVSYMEFQSDYFELDGARDPGVLSYRL